MKATFRDRFDVQVDSSTTDGILEVSVYTVSLDADGYPSTDSLTPVVNVEIPIPTSNGWYVDTWIETTDTKEIDKLPADARAAYDSAVMLAKVLQLHKLSGSEPRWKVGDTVFVTDNRYPAEIIAHTTDGGYIVDEANTGVLSAYSEVELEPYDSERWNK